MVYVFDIDGTICNTEGSDYENSTPKQARINKVNNLYEEGHTVIMQTARGMGRTENNQELAIKILYNFTQSQLDDWGVKYHQLFLGKPAGDYYIDDKGISDKEFFNDKQS